MDAQTAAQHTRHMWNAYVSLLNRQDDTHDAIHSVCELMRLWPTEAFNKPLEEMHRRLMAKRHYQSLAVKRLFNAYRSALYAELSNGN